MSVDQRDSDPLLGRVVDGRFRILRRLGSGGMGAVYLAEQLNLGRQVALKVLKPGAVDEAFRARFKAEALATSRLNHPNIITVHDFGIDATGPSPVPFLVLEHLHGTTLRESLDARGRMPLTDGVAVLSSIADALASAHGQGIIHRDLKPENVFLVDAEVGVKRVKVLDFGIAKILDLDGAQVQTETGVVSGTPGYVAPERMREALDDARGDLYSLGVIAFEVFTGRAPFDAATPLALAMKHLLDPPPRVDSVPGISTSPALETLILSLLSKSPEGRPADARATAIALRALTAVEEKESKASTTTERATAPAQTAETGAVPSENATRSTSSTPKTVIGILSALFLVSAALWMAVRPTARERGAAAAAALNYGAARDAWRTACLDGDARSCGLLADLATKNAADAVFDKFDTLDLWRRACAGGDNRGCVELGRLREYGLTSGSIDADEARHAYEVACRRGDALSCFHQKVAEAVGIGEKRTDMGPIAVLSAELSAAKSDCDGGSIPACFALSQIEIHRARDEDRFDEIVAVRKKWKDWCHSGEGLTVACTHLQPNPNAIPLIVQGVSAYLIGDYKLSQRRNEEALRIQPDHPDALYNLASIFGATNRRDEALKYLRRSLQISPENKDKIVADSDFASIVKDPEFIQVMSDAGVDVKIGEPPKRR